MVNIKSKSPGFFFLITISLFLFVCLSSIKFDAVKGNASKNIQQIKFKMESRAPSLSIVDPSIEDNAVSLSLKNNYHRKLTAFSVISNGVTTRHELEEDDALLPGETITRFFEIPESPTKGLLVVAAVYEDGAFEGTDKYVKQILDARAGRQAQLERLIPILQNMLANTKNKELYQSIQNLKISIEKLPEQEEGKSFEFNSALRGTKELALIRMKRYEEQEQSEGEDSVLKVLTLYKSSCEKKNLMLKNASKQQ
jgi:hypothetical protein